MLSAESQEISPISYNTLFDHLSNFCYMFEKYMNIPNNDNEFINNLALGFAGDRKNKHNVSYLMCVANDFKPKEPAEEKAAKCVISIPDIKNNKELNLTVFVWCDDGNSYGLPMSDIYKLIDFNINRTDDYPDEDKLWLSAIHDSLVSIHRYMHVMLLVSLLSLDKDILKDITKELYRVTLDRILDAALQDVGDRVEHIIEIGMYFYKDPETGVSVGVSNDGPVIKITNNIYLDMNAIYKDIVHPDIKESFKSKMTLLHTFVFDVAIKSQEIRNDINNIQMQNATIH